MTWPVLCAVAVIVLVFATRASAQARIDPDVLPMARDNPNPDVLDSIRDLAQAIARAEGFYVSGSIPQRAHNPGDLTMSSLPHAAVTLGTEGILQFPDDGTGWAALYHQLEMVRTGRSHVYSPDDTLDAFGRQWTATEQDAWIANVVNGLSDLGYAVDASTILRDLLV